jgi:hypothetical protein
VWACHYVVFAPGNFAVSKKLSTPNLFYYRYYRARNKGGCLLSTLVCIESSRFRIQSPMLLTVSAFRDKKWDLLFWKGTHATKKLVPRLSLADNTARESLDMYIFILHDGGGGGGVS